MAYEREARLMAETDAVRVSYSHDPQTGVSRLVRQWPTIDDQTAKSCADYLNSLGKTVEDPKADRKTYAGQWTVVRNEAGRVLSGNARTQGVYQTLTLGSHALEAMVAEKRCDRWVYRTWYFDVAEIPTLPENTTRIMYSMGSVAYDRETGRFSTYVDKIEAKPQDLAVPAWKPDIDHTQKDEQHHAALPEELEAFLNGTFPRDTHNINFQETDPEALRGVRRRITVDINPDCSLNLAGSSTEPEAAGDELDPPIGESFTVLNDLGLYWNQTKAEVLALLATLVAQVVGVTRQVDIQRNDLGRFDVRVQVRTHSEFTAQADATGEGVAVQARAGINSISVPDVGAGKRERVSLDVNPDEKGQIAWKATKQIVQKVVGVFTGGNRKLFYGSNADVEDLPELGASDKLTGGSVQGADDGTVNYGLQVKDASIPTEGSGEITGEEGIRVKSEALDSGDQAAVAGLAAKYTAGKRKRHQLSIRPKDDQTIDASVLEQEVPKIGPITFEGVGEGIKETVVAGRNFDEGDLDIPESGPGIHVRPQVQVEEDGAVSGGFQVTEFPEVPLPEQTAGTKLRKLMIDGMTNDRDDPGVHAEPEDGETISFRGTVNQDGSITWQRMREIASGAYVSVSGGHKEADFTLTIQMTRHVYEPLAALDDDIPAGDAERIEFHNVEIHDNNTCSFIKVKQTLALNAGTHVIMQEDIWQKRDTVVKSFAQWEYTYTEETKWRIEPAGGLVMILGRKQKRRLQRTITRIFSLNRPSISAAENYRKRAGEVRMGLFSVPYVDEEFVSIGEWEGDPSGNGLYFELITLIPPEE